MSPEELYQDDKLREMFKARQEEASRVAPHYKADERGLVFRIEGIEGTDDAARALPLGGALQNNLPTTGRKDIPMARGLLDYFPNALAAVAELSRAGNNQHNPGEPMHWSRNKSTDHADCLVRHLVDRGKYDTDGSRHSTKVAWRALALLQIELEEDR
jgi:hypothetical protein